MLNNKYYGTFDFFFFEVYCGQNPLHIAKALNVPIEYLVTGKILLKQMKQSIIESQNKKRLPVFRQSFKS